MRMKEMNQGSGEHTGEVVARALSECEEMLR